MLVLVAWEAKADALQATHEQPPPDKPLPQAAWKLRNQAQPRALEQTGRRHLLKGGISRLESGSASPLGRQLLSRFATHRRRETAAGARGTPCAKHRRAHT